MFAFKPDYERALERIDAFWQNEIIDRPIVQISVRKPEEECVPEPVSGHATPDDRWLDAEYNAELALARTSNTVYLAESMPVAFPNLGPEIFSAFYGCPIHFGDYGTSWTDPILEDWSQATELQMDMDGYYWHKLVEMTDAMIEASQGRFIVGMTDWHPGGDCLAAFRDPANLAMDLVTNLDDVKHLLVRAEQDYMRAYDIFYAKLRAAGMPITTWLPLVSNGKYYVPSNDFSIMISPAMFDDVFLPGLRRECQFLDCSIYHLDGPGALRHLDSILSIPELNALQFVPGAGNTGYEKWIDVYQKAQAAGKGIQVFCDYSDLDLIMETLDPHGLLLTMGGVSSQEQGESVLKRLEQWCVGRVHPAAQA